MGVALSPAQRAALEKLTDNDLIALSSADLSGFLTDRRDTLIRGLFRAHYEGGRSSRARAIARDIAAASKGRYDPERPVRNQILRLLAGLCGTRIPVHNTILKVCQDIRT